MKLIHTNQFVDAMLALPLLRTLNQYYPRFDHWYINKVVPGVVLGSDALVVAKDGEHIVGVALGKATRSETKLRCVRVLPAYQQRGTGIRLIDKMIEVLEHEKPHCTVSEELLHTYSRAFVNRYGFEISEVKKGIFRPRVLEYYFN